MDIKCGKKLVNKIQGSSREFPKWPDDIETGLDLVSKEFDELQQAVVLHGDAVMGYENIENQALSLGATVIRFMTAVEMKRKSF